MNVERAILQLKEMQRYQSILVYAGAGKKCCLYPDDFPAIELALAALRAQQERENPKPLTLEQLKEREGKPVYIIDTYHGGMKIWNIWDDSMDEEEEREYGKTWNAYDYEPGGEKG